MRRFPKVFLALSMTLLATFLPAQSIVSLVKATHAHLWYDPYRVVFVISNANRTVSLDPQTHLAVWQDLVLELSQVQSNAQGLILEPQDFTRLVALLNGAEPAPALPVVPKPPSKSRPVLAVIVLDPGHGGKDPGCMVTNVIDGKKVTLKEKNLTLAVVLELAKLLESRFPQKRIVLTRSNDTYPTLEDRVKIANSQKLTGNEGILFLSVHFNASVDKNARGLEFWYVPQNFQREVLSHRALPEIPNDAVPVMNAWLDGEYKKESFELADDLSRALAKELGTSDPARSLKQNPFFVVRHTRMPAVLAELGFLTNPNEALLLHEPEYLKKLAQGLYNGVVSFVGNFEGGS
jgi:N-acetylmuramoyl-L-alanine amidase